MTAARPVHRCEISGDQHLPRPDAIRRIRHERVHNIVRAQSRIEAAVDCAVVIEPSDPALRLAVEIDERAAHQELAVAADKSFGQGQHIIVRRGANVECTVDRAVVVEPSHVIDADFVQVGEEAADHNPAIALNNQGTDRIARAIGRRRK